MRREESFSFVIFRYVTLAMALFVVFFPLYSVFVGAFKTQIEYYQSGLRLPANLFNFDNFSKVIDIGKLGLGFKNIFIILVIAVAGNIMFGTMVAYAIGRFDFKLKNRLWACI